MFSGGWKVDAEKVWIEGKGKKNLTDDDNDVRQRKTKKICSLAMRLGTKLIQNSKKSQ